MKFREGNVFSHRSICLSVHRNGPMWPLPMVHWTSLYNPSLDMGSHCTRALPVTKVVAITGHLFKLVHLRTPPSPGLTSGDYWSVYGWRKRAVLQSYRVKPSSESTLSYSVRIWAPTLNDLYSLFCCEKYTQFHHKWKFILNGTL